MKFDLKKFNIKKLFKKIKKDNADSTFENKEEKEGNDFFDKVEDFFNFEPQKERVLRHEDFKGAGDPYYASVSAGFKVAERILILILAIFLIFSLITNYREITYSNIFYLFRDFSSVSDSLASNYETLSYDADERQNFALFHGGIASASPSYISVFSSGGRRTLKSNTEYDSPNIISCDKYILVYDTAGASFSIYNSFSKLYSKKLDGPISYACFNKNGEYALATRQNEIETVIYVYNDDGKPIAKCGDGKYVFGIALDDKAENVSAVYYESGAGIGKTTLCIYDIRAEAENRKTEITVDGEFPVKCEYLFDDIIALVTNKSIRMYGRDGKEKEHIGFENYEIKAFCADAGGVAVSLSNETNRKIIAFNSKGKQIYNNNFEENVSEIAVYENYIFLYSPVGVIRIDIKKNEKEFLPCGGNKMLVYDERTAIVCSDSRAEYLVFNK